MTTCGACSGQPLEQAYVNGGIAAEDRFRCRSTINGQQAGGIIAILTTGGRGYCHLDDMDDDARAGLLSPFDFRYSTVGQHIDDGLALPFGLTHNSSIADLRP